MHNKTARKRRSGGFTIVEIIVVVVIIAALATMIMPNLMARLGKAKQSVAKQKIVEIEKAVDTFFYDYERLPETLEELVVRPADIEESKWEDPPIKAKDLKDPWGREFIYKKPGDHGRYDLYSLGADGLEGGEKDNEDIHNW